MTIEQNELTGIENAREVCPRVPLDARRHAVEFGSWNAAAKRAWLSEAIVPVQPGGSATMPRTRANSSDMLLLTVSRPTKVGGDESGRACHLDAVLHTNPCPRAADDGRVGADNAAIGKQPGASTLTQIVDARNVVRMVRVRHHLPPIATVEKS